MTAPTLPETLARLAQLLPDRVLLVATTHVIVRVYGRPAPLLFSEAHNLDALEFALREECAARGWPAQLTLNPPGMGRPHGAVIWSGGWHSGGMPSGPLHFGKSDTPAHALALALVSALGGEGT